MTKKSKLESVIRTRKSQKGGNSVPSQANSRITTAIAALTRDIK